MNAKHLIGITAALVMALGVATAGPAAADEHESMDLQERLEAFVGLVPGGATAVTVRNGVISSAATGILDDQGGPVTPETPFLVGPLGIPMTVATALQLVDEGLLELDEPVATYLPDAPVAEGATVRQVLEWRAGVPDNYGQMIDLTLRDKGHGWTRQELIDLLEPEMVGTAGDWTAAIGHEVVAELLIEAVEGKDFGTVLSERLGEPLGLSATYDVSGDDPQPPDLAMGWMLELGLSGDQEVDLAGFQTLDGRSSSAIDTAIFLQALVDGEVISDELLEVVFDEDAVFSSMGFDTHEEALGHLGDLGTRYYLSSGNLISGYAGSLAVSPETGDILVILASNDRLPTWQFLHETVSSWAPDSE